MGYLSHYAPGCVGGVYDGNFTKKARASHVPQFNTKVCVFYQNFCFQIANFILIQILFYSYSDFYQKKKFKAGTAAKPIG